MRNITKIYEKLIDMKEYIYVYSLLVFIFASILQYSLLAYISQLNLVFIILRRIAFLLTLLKISLDIVELFLQNRRECINLCIKLFALLSIIIVSCYISDINSLIFTIIFVIGARNIRNKNNIFKKVFYLEIAVLVCLSILSKLEVITMTHVSYRNGLVRNTCGFDHPSVAPSLFFTICLLYFWNKKENITFLQTIIILILNYLLYRYTGTRSAYYAVILLSITNYVVPMIEKKINESFLHKLSDLLQYTPIFLVILTLIAVCLYNMDFVMKIDNVLSGRISYIYNAFHNYKITLFGNRITWIGWAGVTDNTFDYVGQNHNFIDNSYMYFLFNFGVIPYLLLLSFLIYNSKEICNTYSIRKYYSWLLFLVFCLFEPRLTELQFNILLICGADIFNNTSKYLLQIK